MNYDRSSMHPYKGPVPYGEEDEQNFFGRNADIDRLRGLLRTERIVVLHSPSGAGKTSLIQAGLLPRMREDGFKTLPPIRVSHPLPESVSDADGANRFSFSVIRSIEAALEPSAGATAAKVNEAGLAGIPLSTYFDHRSALRADEERLFLVFDQFEEVFTIKPHERRDKLQFFTELGRVLLERQIWALFAIRKEYVGALDIYSRLVPTNFASRYHLDLLTRSSAQEAIREPVERLGMRFDPMAVMRILNDLVGVNTSDQSLHRPLGDEEKTADSGPDDAPIDPLYLQLVCEQVWAAVQSEPVTVTEITEEAVGKIQKVEGLTPVDVALMKFYEDTLEQAAEEHACFEREIRDWIEQELIQDGWRRRPALEADPGSVLARVQVFLEKRLILSPNFRANSKWYELSHDRMVLPVRKSNEQWYEANLSQVEQYARRWLRDGMPQKFPLPGFKEWLQYELSYRGNREKHPLSGAVKEYLEFCRKGFGRRLIVGAGLPVIVLLVIFAFYQEAQNLATQKESDSTQKAGTVRRILGLAMQQRYTYQNHDIALLLGTHALNLRDRSAGKTEDNKKFPTRLECQKSIWAALEATPFCRTLTKGSLGGQPRALFPSRAGARILIESGKEWKTATLNVQGERDEVQQSVDSCGDLNQSYFMEERFVASVEKGALRVMQTSDCANKGEPVRPPEGKEFAEKPPVYSHDAKYGAIYLADGDVAIYGVDFHGPDLPEHALVRVIPRMPGCREDKVGEGCRISAVAFYKSRAAIGDERGGVRVYELGSESSEPLHCFQLSDDDWPLQKSFNENPSYAKVVALSLAGDNPEWLTTVHSGGLLMAGGRILRRRIDSPHSPHLVLPDQESRSREKLLIELRQLSDSPSGEAFLSAFFEPDGQRLITGGEQGAVSEWQLGKAKLEDAVPLDPFNPKHEEKAPPKKAYTVPRRLLPGMTGSALAVLSTSVEGVDGRERRLVLCLDSASIVRIWDLVQHHEGYLTEQLDEDDVAGYSYALAFDSKNRLIKTDNTGKIATWQLKRGPLTAEKTPIREASGSIRTIGVHGNYVVTGWKDKLARILHLSQPSVLQEIRDSSNPEIHHEVGLWAAAFRPQNPDFKNRYDMATGDADGKILFWELAPSGNGKELTSNVSGSCKFEDRISALSFDPDGNLLLVGTDTIAGKEHGEPKRHVSLIDMEGSRCIKDPQGDACQGGPCVAWTAASGEEGVPLPPIHGAAFSNDGLKFVVGGDYGTVLLWALDRVGKLPNSLVGTELGGAKGKVNAVAFLPQSDMVAAVGQDGILRIWALKAGGLVEADPLPLKQAGTELLSLAVSGYDQLPPLIAAGDARGRFHLWDLNTTGYVCRLVLRNLTDKEWKTSDEDKEVYSKICPTLP